MSNVIRTTAPISIEQLKQYFVDKSTSYIIDYDNSTLQDQKLLTYFGNLDLPVDVELDLSKPTHRQLFKAYLETPTLVKMASLESAAFNCLMARKGLMQLDDDFGVLSECDELLHEWECRLDSLTLYNMTCVVVDDFKHWVDQHPVDDSDATKYANFINLLRYDGFYTYFEAVSQSNVKYYPKLFTEYCFKGKNLYEFWAVPQNPLFLLTWGIATAKLDIQNHTEVLVAELSSVQAA